MNRFLQFVSDNVVKIWVAIVVLFCIVGILNTFLAPVVDGYAHFGGFRP